VTTIVRRRRLGMSSARGIASFSRTGIRWVRSDRPMPEDDTYIRWGCTADVPARNVINTASAIHEVNDKATFRIKTAEAGLSPASYTNIRDMSDDDIGVGVIFRPAKHSQGRNIFHEYTFHDLLALSRRFPDYYVSEFIPKVAEYRVAVVQGRAVWVVQKTPDNPDAIAWNVSRGGRFDNVNWDAWDLKVVKTAIEAFNLSSLDFGGVDVMVDVEGNCYVLEINSAPSLTSPYRQECMAKAFDYIVENGKARIPMKEERGGYLKFIHPAICDRAELVGGEG